SDNINVLNNYDTGEGPSPLHIVSNVYNTILSNHESRITIIPFKSFMSFMVKNHIHLLDKYHLILGSVY
ncbi:MAG: hypothetical protein PHV06_09545, partial [bacterium]|nr:hypothetical protein [bacterium]